MQATPTNAADEDANFERVEFGSSRDIVRDSSEQVDFEVELNQAP